MIFRFLLAGLLQLSQVHAGPEPGRRSATTTSVVLTIPPDAVLFGHPEILTATVQPPGVTGWVTFYSGVSVLGVSPLAIGQATLTTSLLSAGPNRLTARFDSTPTFASSLSSPVQLNIAVTPGAGFSGGVMYPVGTTPVMVATADLNADGLSDIVTANAGDGTISVMTGIGAGAFQAMPDIDTGVNPVFVAIGDFNGDGKQDIAVVNSGDPSVLILLGNGDGTFAILPPVLLWSNPVAAVVCDFNGDGKADLAVLDANSDTVTILPGVGDGTFGTRNTIAIGLSPAQIAAGDFNGDGKADLAIIGTNPDGLAILLGNGDGTFALQALLNAGTAPSSVLVGDFNGDGLADVAVGDYGDYFSLNGGGIIILPGNRDGSFQSPLTAATGPNVLALASGDINGDSKSDLAAVSLSGLITYLGNGDGTLQAVQSVPSGLSPDALAIGSFDGTGMTEIAVANQNENQVAVLTSGTAACTYVLAGAPQIYDSLGGGGSVTLTASASGCPWTVTSDSWIMPLISDGLGSATISFEIAPNQSGSDRSGTLTVGGQTVSVTQKGTAQQFADVPPSAYYFDAINLMKNQNITAGCGGPDFCPASKITRAQMAIFLVRAAYGGDNFTSSSQPYFADVPSNGFGFRWIQKLAELGVTTGCGGGKYCPDNVVTRDQMAVFLVRSRFGSTAGFSSPPTPYFTDVPSGAFGFPWIQRMKFDGITGGCGVALYCPANSVTRGDMAVFIMRGLFNDLFPAGTPVLTSVSPNALIRGQPATFTITGSATSFTQGVTAVTTVPHVSVSNIQVSSPTVLSVDLAADASAPVQPEGLVTITGAEQAVLPNGITIQ